MEMQPLTSTKGAELKKNTQNIIMFLELSKGMLQFNNVFFVLTGYKPNYHFRRQMPFYIKWRLARRTHHVNESIVYLQREEGKSQLDAQNKDENGNFSVESILIIWDALLMCTLLVPSMEQNQRRNHTWCCFLFKRNMLSLAPPPCP